MPNKPGVSGKGGAVFKKEREPAKSFIQVHQFRGEEYAVTVSFGDHFYAGITLFYRHSPLGIRAEVVIPPFFKLVDCVEFTVVTDLGGAGEDLPG